MRIVVATDRFPELSETFVTAELEALAALGHAVRVEAGTRSEVPNAGAATRFDVHYLEEDSRDRKLRDASDGTPRQACMLTSPVSTTLAMLNDVFDAVKEMSRQGRVILFVGTKKQAQDVVKEESERAGTFFVNQRWLGGTLTNFATIQKRISRLRELEGMRQQGTFDLLPKKEVARLTDELEKLEKFLGGIKDMHRLPDAMFIVDPKKERIAVAEAQKLHIPIIAVIDTNSARVVKLISLGQPQALGTAPVKLAVAPDGRTLYAANSGEDTVAAISLTQRPAAGARIVPRRVFAPPTLRAISNYAAGRRAAGLRLAKTHGPSRAL